MPQRVFDPRGIVEASPKSRAPRAASLKGLRLAVLDNTKWNAARLLEAVVARLGKDVDFAAVNRYKKETFTKPAGPALLREMAANNDVALVAIGD
jgi:hypothetical protein